ncbi:MAG: methylenetetrahydrofolate reductase C-terminal domain-containing protein [Anaerolineae bacterium]|nr:methylenetetrahydrofolate reductase C-terminal domain-containing protein [Anaerolineae bacterium]
MIIGEQKPLEEIKQLVADHDSILVLGCGTCVTVCFTGGEKEVGVLASSLRIATKIDGNPKVINEATVQRQCEWEFLDAVRDQVEKHDLILSLACGIGVQAIAERFPQARAAPAVNTTFLGLPEEVGLWTERCAACGDCLLDQTAGICPIARCAKSLLNGPCGGSQGGKCEIDPEVPCAWQLIYDRLAAQGRLEQLLEITPAKDWSRSRDGGPRRLVREELRLESHDNE